jgi:hypothetical protein
MAAFCADRNMRLPAIGCYQLLPKNANQVPACSLQYFKIHPDALLASIYDALILVLRCSTLRSEAAILLHATLNLTSNTSRIPIQQTGYALCSHLTCSNVAHAAPAWRCQCSQHGFALSTQVLLPAALY